MLYRHRSQSSLPKMHWPKCRVTDIWESSSHTTSSGTITLITYWPKQRAYLLSDPLPPRPFENTAADLFHYSGHTFLVYTDRYSGWPAVGTTGHTSTSSDVIYLLKEWMTDKGIPTILKTDGGPQFASQAFSDFCREWGIHHVPQQSPPPWGKRSRRGCFEGHESARRQDNHHWQNRHWRVPLRATGIPEHATGAWLQSSPTLVWPDASLPAAHSPDRPEARVARATQHLDKAATSLMAKAKPARQTRPPLSILAPAQSSMCNTHAPSGGTRSPRSSSESLVVTATPSRQRAGEYTGVTAAFFVCTLSAELSLPPPLPPPPSLWSVPQSQIPRRGMWHHHMLLVPATLSGWACARPLVLRNTSCSSLSCSLGLWVLNNVGVRPLYLSLVKLCRVG